MNLRMCGDGMGGSTDLRSTDDRRPPCGEIEIATPENVASDED